MAAIAIETKVGAQARVDLEREERILALNAQAAAIQVLIDQAQDEALPVGTTLNQVAAPTAPVALNGQRMTGGANPVAPQDLATKAFVEGVRDSIINGAPGALDALNELAAAFGNDPNFAATMATALAGKVSALQAAMNPDLLIVGTITRDANGAATSAPVVWPDGTSGTYTATTVSAAFPGAVDAYTITYGSPVTKTYTQSAVTRNADGAVTIRPAMTVA